MATKKEKLSGEKEKTLVIIKPDAIHLADEIFEELDKIAKRIHTIKIEKAAEEIIREHYRESIKKHGDFLWIFLKEYIVNNPLILALYEGEKAIERIRDKVGHTDPEKAHHESIRGKYSDDSLQKALTEKRAVRNAIHASESLAEFDREFSVWREFFEEIEEELEN